MNLRQIKQIIKESIMEIRVADGRLPIREQRMLLREAKECSCCGRFAAGSAAQECMDGGGTATGTKSDCGYNVTCSGMTGVPRDPRTAQSNPFGPDA